MLFSSASSRQISSTIKPVESTAAGVAESLSVADVPEIVLNASPLVEDEKDVDKSTSKLIILVTIRELRLQKICS